MNKSMINILFLNETFLSFPIFGMGILINEVIFNDENYALRQWIIPEPCQFKMTSGKSIR